MCASGWVLTCDPGIDDAIALVVAAGREDCRLEAIVAAAGNVPAPTAWRNAAGMAALVGLAAPVGIGSADALDGTPIHREGARHGPDGLGGLGARLPAVEGPPSDGLTSDRLPSDGLTSDRPASEGLASEGLTSDRPPSEGLASVRDRVLATGPLTDCARWLHAGRRIERVVWMGGSVAELAPATSSNDSVIAEFNAAADPDAVEAVLRAPAAVAVVPIEVTHRVRLQSDDLARWSTGSPISRFCAALAATRSGATATHATTGTDATLDPGIAIHDAVAGTDATPDSGIAIHDAVAVIAALDPHLFDWSPRRLTVRESGRLISRPGPPNALLAVDVDARAVRTRIVTAVETAVP